VTALARNSTFALAATVCFIALSGASCKSGAGTANANTAAPLGAATGGDDPGIKKTQGASNGASAFDAARAYADLKTQVAFGPRVPNTPGHDKCRDWIIAEMDKAGVKASRQDFSQVIGGKTLAMTNIVAQINPEATKQVMLCAHWDTRPTADQEVDEAKRKQPIPGANDGASGVAVLLELARNFAAKKPEIGVQFVFLDGEDYGPHSDRMYLGAKYYAKKPALPKPTYAILLDMIGDKNLDIYREKNSETQARAINDKVWAAADAVGAKGFVYGVGYEIEDDHLPLLAAGIPTIDLIDFNYGPWHTLDDDADKCSGESLKQVGDVMAKVIHDEK